MLDRSNIQYEYIDMTTSMQALKEFLKLRENREEFKPIIAQGRVGVPMLLIDNKIYFDIDSKLIESLK